MTATEVQELVDLAIQELELRMVPSWTRDRLTGGLRPLRRVLIDGTAYSPSTRAYPHAEQVWELDDPEAWSYFEGKLDDWASEAGYEWHDGELTR